MRSSTLPASWTFHGERPELRGRWGSPPVDGRDRHQVLDQVVQGEHHGREFWAFTTPIAGVRGGWRRTVVALDAGRALPRATVEPQTLDDRLLLGGLRRLLGPARQRGVLETELVTGPALDWEFDRRYRIRTRRPDEVRLLLTPPVRSALLASERLSLASDGTDVLCWRKHTGSPPVKPDLIESLLTLAAAVVADSFTSS